MITAPPLRSRKRYVKMRVDMTPVDKIGSAFLRRILKQMKKLGVNQTELARRMNVSRPYVTAVLKHDVNISFLTAAKLARALRMDFFPDLIDRSSRKTTSRQHFSPMGSDPRGHVRANVNATCSKLISED